MCNSSQTLIKSRRLQILSHIHFRKQPFRQNSRIFVYQQPGPELVEGDLLSRSKEAEEDLSVPLKPSEGEGSVLQVEIPRKIPLVYVCAIVALIVHVERPEEPKIEELIKLSCMVLIARSHNMLMVEWPRPKTLDLTNPVQQWDDKG